MHDSYWTLDKEHILNPKPHTFSEVNFAKAQPLTHCTYQDHAAVPEGGVRVSSEQWVCAKCWPLFVKRKLKK